jgi:NDP-sugar pyrophosphorylase family protein
MSTAGPTAIILAGSHHWSGSLFERLAPRPLVPIALAPLISYSLDWLARGGVRRATICANGTTPAIESTLGDVMGAELELDYYKDATPRGAAGCLRDAALRAESDTLVVTDGTAIPTVDFAELLASHRASGAAMTAVVHREGAPSGPPTPAGTYVLARRILRHIAETGFQDIKENLIPKLRRAGERVVAHESSRFCPHVFNAQTYLAVNQWMLQRLALEDAGTGRLLVHPTACVEPGARLVGPVQLGAGARVQAGATIVGPTSIGPESNVGRNAMVGRSVVWSRCALGDGAMVHGCVVGDDAVIFPGTRLFNAVHAQPQVATGALGVNRRRQPRTPLPSGADAAQAFVSGASASPRACGRIG